MTGLRAELTVWGVAPRAVPAATLRMALDRRHLRGVAGLRFAKLLGTGTGASFTLRDADPLHWGLLTVWDDERGRLRFGSGPTRRAWDRIARERLDVVLRPVASRGRWSGRAPFDDPAAPAAGPAVAGGVGSAPEPGPVAAITRARLRPARARSFWRAVPPVSADLRGAPGLRLALGIGEAPVGLQGTFSLWDDVRSLRTFAYRGGAHADVVARTAAERWYAEELFARFAVEQVRGTFRGVDPLDGGVARREGG